MPAAPAIYATETCSNCPSVPCASRSSPSTAKHTAESHVKAAKRTRTIDAAKTNNKLPQKNLFLHLPHALGSRAPQRHKQSEGQLLMRNPGQYGLGAAPCPRSNLTLHTSHGAGAAETSGPLGHHNSALSLSSAAVRTQLSRRCIRPLQASQPSQRSHVSRINCTRVPSQRTRPVCSNTPALLVHLCKAVASPRHPLLGSQPVPLKRFLQVAGHAQTVFVPAGAASFGAQMFSVAKPNAVLKRC